ncbi:Polysaccharide deacetylase [Pigmentiphaga humi]|uniref:Polysaccharide deacetylase n=1 Tax=Pigmentiphaga humi TaxID=2478468 RepID=A0A3P4B6W7_9BURK|nr:polysaccharide deacetylase family protein [Pigmentiphaga humi]VCU72039.1 Polysaccharide deacetylase [Pigmentiphaga humi]
MEIRLPRHSRYDYVPLTERKDYSWPDGRRLAFCLTTNIECFAYGKGRGMDPAKHGEPQNHRNYSWRDYGNRIGVWRLFDLFDDLKLPVAHNTNSLLYEHAPQVFDAIRRRGDEIVAHGRTNGETLRDFNWEADEARVIQEITETFRRHEGKPPKGWMGPGAAENSTTPDLLKEAGYRYTMDWPADDQPFYMNTRSGKLLSIPYPVELNDAQQAIHRAHTPRDFCEMMVDQFEEMLEQCEHHPLVYNISIHPFIFGQPYRLRPFREALKHMAGHSLRDRIWFCRPEDVAEHCFTLAPGIIPGSE